MIEPNAADRKRLLNEIAEIATVFEKEGVSSSQLCRAVNAAAEEQAAELNDTGDLRAQIEYLLRRSWSPESVVAAAAFSKLGYCPLCKVGLKPGIALQTTFTAGMPDFIGEKDSLAVTISPGGPGKIVGAAKCPKCGFSREF